MFIRFYHWLFGHRYYASVSKQPGGGKLPTSNVVAYQRTNERACYGFTTIIMFCRCGAFRKIEVTGTNFQPFTPVAVKTEAEDKPSAK